MFLAEVRAFELVDQSVRLDITLRRQRTTRFAGRILDAEGCPIGAPVQATIEWEGGGPLQCTTDEQGYFELPAAPVGRVVLRTTELIRTEMVGPGPRGYTTSPVTGSRCRRRSRSSRRSASRAR
jgi:hypothetical protein